MFDKVVCVSNDCAKCARLLALWERAHLQVGLHRRTRLVPLFSCSIICLHAVRLAQYPLHVSTKIPSLALLVICLHLDVSRLIPFDTRATTLIRVVHPATRARPVHVIANRKSLFICKWQSIVLHCCDSITSKYLIASLEKCQTLSFTPTSRDSGCYSSV